MSEVTLRHAVPADAPALAEVNVAAWRVGYRDLLAAGDLDRMDQDERRAFWEQVLAAPPDGTGVVVAERAGSGVIGFAGFGPASALPGTGEVFTCYVHPDHWGAGAGRMLLRAARRLLRSRGFASAQLWVLDGNERAMGVYRADGWATDGTERDELVWGTPVRTVRMVRSLADEPYLTTNREAWDELSGWYAEQQRDSWTREPSWGIFGLPDTEVGILDEDLTGLEVVELGCGTGYVSAWCLQRGAARAVGVDNSPGQLATAAAAARRHGLPLHLVLADAEQAPLNGASFDLAISEYGAAIWCDPRRWIPEAARLLRPGGTLVFLGNSALFVLCAPDFEDQPAGDRLLRPQRGMHRFEWPDTDAVEFHVSHGEMIRILRDAGFDVVDLVELYAHPDATTSYGFVDGAWASRWPVEEVWVARRR